ncbi:MAG: accessory gene regulator B family protein [Lachnospiraceae bacterium]|nr:accessory gene regulator B family protein [Lachnospiraceae bacterium]
MNYINDYIRENMSLTVREQKLFVYYLKCILYDVSKLILFLFIFSMLHMLPEFLLTFVIQFPLRTISGGLHFRHYWSCFTFSLVYLFLIITLFRKILIPFEIGIVLLLLCIIIIYQIGQVRSPSRPSLSDIELLRRKRAVLIAAGCETLTAVLVYQTDFAPIIYWSIILHTLQLIIGKWNLARLNVPQ